MRGTDWLKTSCEYSENKNSCETLEALHGETTHRKAYLTTLIAITATEDTDPFQLSTIVVVINYSIRSNIFAHRLSYT